jgi:FRG domain
VVRSRVRSAFTAERQNVSRTDGGRTLSTEGTEAPEPVPDVSALLWRTKIDHPDTFVSQLTGITSKWTQSHSPREIRPWFRGMPLITFSLEPSLLRYRPNQLRIAEHNFRHEFRLLGSRLFDQPLVGALDCMTVMQHHGMPTRLLDWTENAFAALYFSVRQSEYFGVENDAVVWMLDPVRLCEIQLGSATIPFADDRVLELEDRQPLPLYPAHRSIRVTAQRAAFTVHPFGPQHALFSLALKEVAEGRRSFLYGLQIRGDKRALIRDGMIRAFGSGDFTFFPDLDGLARELRMRSRFEGKG